MTGIIMKKVSDFERFTPHYFFKLVLAFFLNICIINVHASLAQSVEHFTRNEGVAGSNPA